MAEDERNVSNEQTADAGESRGRSAERAYELYEQRGRADGFDVQDWLQAEQEVHGRAEVEDEPAGENVEAEGRAEVGAKAAKQT
jgi:hypothetical protein